MKRKPERTHISMRGCPLTPSVMAMILCLLPLSGYLAAAGNPVRNDDSSARDMAVLDTSLNTEATDSAVPRAVVLTLKGYVRNAKTHEPVPAAQVLALNHEASATADDSGTFSIGLYSSNDVLLIRAFDYNRREIAVRGRESLVIDLYPEDFTEDYGVMESPAGMARSSEMTNAASTPASPLSPMFVSLDEAVSLQMGGDVRAVSRSGLSGMGSSLFIRGYSSLHRDAQPLFIVDGIIWNNHYDRYSLHDGFYTNSLADIDLNDIKSVTLIKDGTSIYGSRGSKGVILVRTRRAEDVTTKIVVNAHSGITERPGSLPMMNGDQFRIYATDILGTIDLPGDIYDELEYLQDDPSSTSYPQYHNKTDWDDEVYRRGFTQSYNIGVTGGDDKALYAFSLGYTGNRGVVKTTDMDRLNMRFNGDFNLTDFFDMGLNIGFTNVDRTLLDDGVNIYTGPAYLAMVKSPFLSPYTYTVDGTLTADFEDADVFGIGNPTAIIENSLNTNSHYRLNIGALPVLKLGRHITISSQFDYSLDRVKETYFSPMLGVIERQVPGLGISENVFRSLQMRNNTLFSDTRVRYTRVFRSVHNLDAMLGWRYISDFLEADYAEGHNSGTDQKRNLLAEEEFKNTAGLNDVSKSISNYAALAYNYDKRYFLNAAMAMDGSSRFGRETASGISLFGHSWGFFPSLNGAWLVSSESFMSSAGFVDHLKIRAGLDITGNDDIDPYAWSPYFISVKYMGRANGIILGNIGNPEVQWETTASLHAGVDARLFNERLALSADLYTAKTRDLLFLDTLPELAGTGYYWNNGGEMSNRGFELSARVKVLNLRNLHWEMGLSIGRYKNEILSLPGSDYTTSLYGADILTSVGNPAGVFYGYKTDGVLADEAEAEAADLKVLDADGIEHSLTAGDVRFMDHHEDGILDEKDKQVIGDPNPDFYGSFDTRLSYRNLRLDVYFSYSYGNEVYNYLRRTVESGIHYEDGIKFLPNQSTAMLSRWISEGQQTGRPKMSYEDPVGNARFSDLWIEDGSYLKLKTLKLSYEIPLKGGIIEGLNVWVAVNNVWTLTSYLGRDPEVSAGNAVLYQGIDRGLLPGTRSYFLGLKMNL
jgi:TonB-linked SusC/RagA family outer membrane protein